MKRLFLYLLILPLIAASFCGTSFAEIDYECGPNATWYLSNGILTISGTGKMYNYDVYSKAPWRNSIAKIDKIIIEPGITSIGDEAFKAYSSDNWKPSSIEIPNTVTSIGEDCFESCFINSINIPEGVTILKNGAFSHSGIKTIYLPSTLKTIETSAFYGCGKLTDVYYSGSQNQWENIEISGNNEPLTEASIHYNASNSSGRNSETNIDDYYSCGPNATWYLSNSILTISGTGKMYNYDVYSKAPWRNSIAKIDKIIIEPGITSIGDEAFKAYSSDNWKPSSIEIPNTVTSIGEDCFESCFINSINIPEGVTILKNGAFSHSGIKTIYLPSTLKTIETSAFYGCGKLTDVYYSGSQNQWENIEISGNNEPLTEASIHFQEINGLHLDTDGILRYYENGFFTAKTGVMSYGNIQCLIIDGVYASDPEYSGIWIVYDTYYLFSNGIVQTQFNGLYLDAGTDWWFVQNGIVDFNYTGLWNDPNVGWWFVQDGQINFNYTGLYCDTNFGWWLINGGTIAWDYCGLWSDPNYGWWLINGGTIAFDYTGLWNDSNYGWWLVAGGTIAWDYTGLWNDPNCGWWLIAGGTIAWDYTGLWCDPNVGWWLIGNGTICWDYTGLWNDPNYGWWLIGGGTIAWDYNGLWNDPNYGWWLINGGTINWGYTGTYDQFDATWNIVNGQLIF